MKKILSMFVFFVGSLFMVACNNSTTTQSTTTTEVTTTTTTKPTTTTKEKVNHMFNSEITKRITSMGYANEGKMGDQDGPAFAVYSNKGYNGASVDLNLEDLEISTRLPGSKYVNGYAFLGIDVYSQGGGWINCVDVGLCWSGLWGGWHIFYNIYSPLNESTPTWYESTKKLPNDDHYNLTFVITEDNYAKLVVTGHNNGFTDEVTVEVKGAKTDGSRTGFLFNVALDFPPNTKVDREGNPCENWKEITYANTDKGIYLKNLHAYNLKLHQNDNEVIDWTNDLNSAVSIWPDKVLKFDYNATMVGLFDGRQYVINLDVNRK